MFILAVVWTVEMADGSETLFGNSILLEMTDPNQQEEHVTFGMEICEDLWTPIAPGRLLALQGAEILLNLSASNEVIGKDLFAKRSWRIFVILKSRISIPSSNGLISPNNFPFSYIRLWPENTRSEVDS